MFNQMELFPNVPWDSYSNLGDRGELTMFNQIQMNQNVIEYDDDGLYSLWP